MSELPTNLRCPNCTGPLAPVALGCPTCDLKIEGRFVLNEFATLDAEQLHFLRIFVHSEGKIREMEAALGVSYPTIKARMAKLKETLAATVAAKTPTPPDTPESQVAATLRDLEAGRLSFDEAMRRIKDKT